MPLAVFSLNDDVIYAVLVCLFLISVALLRHSAGHLM